MANKCETSCCAQASLKKRDLFSYQNRMTINKVTVSLEYKRGAEAAQTAVQHFATRYTNLHTLSPAVFMNT